MSIHLLVLVHGMWGNPNHLAEARRIIVEKFDAADNGEVQLEVLVAQANSDKSTYDGIDWGGERIAEEVLTRVEDIERDGTKKVTRFSAVGYSLGGLLARYVLGVLLTRKFFDNVQPVNFATFATPHFGLPRSGSFRSKLFARLGPHFLSRTGEHFYGVDTWSDTGRPLLEVMVDKDRVFFQALALFPHVEIYANAVNDTTVPYVTAALEPKDPFMAHETNGIEIHFDEQYEPLVKSFELPPSPPPPPPKPRVLSFEYLRSLKPSRPWLPPVFQFRFPFDVLFTLLVPVLLPVVLFMLLFRLGLDARASRARIRLLERDPSSSGRLINMLRSIEKEVDDVVADMLDDPQQSSDKESGVQAQVESDNENDAPAPSVAQPVLTRTQQLVLSSLNSLPQLQKHFAFIHPVRNSHAVIVSRDVKKFEYHKRGEGVLRHWADRFEL